MSSQRARRESMAFYETGNLSGDRRGVEREKRGIISCRPSLVRVSLSYLLSWIAQLLRSLLTPAVIVIPQSPSVARCQRAETIAKYVLSILSPSPRPTPGDSLCPQSTTSHTI